MKTKRQKAYEILKRVKEKRRAAIVAIAKGIYASGDGMIEVDDSARLSEGVDNGTYVAAWVWVGFAGTPWDKDK